MDLSIVLPVRDERAAVSALVGELDALPRATGLREIVFVDDGSRDGTAQALARLAAARAADRPPLRVVRHRASLGQSTALRSGVRAASAPWVVTLDGDGQNDPADIPLLLDALRRARPEGGPALVAGERRERRDSWLRRVSSRLANGVRRRVLHDGVADTGCGLKLFPRDAYLELPFFDHQHRFLPALFQCDGIPVVTVPVHHRPRLGGRSKYGVHNRLWAGLADLLGVWWLCRRGRRAESQPPAEAPWLPAAGASARMLAHGKERP
ncbi:MAG: glycosyltransferase family 2 protein [Thermoanaerobaculia bacterium]|nr:glycosyltransferase family 2 protein [Thermoanaerobaculia bacterium]